MRNLILLAPAVVLAACASSTTPHYDARFGDALRQARLAQSINPNVASSNPLTGMDGKAAREAAERYHDSFRKPPQPINVINVGGGR